MLAPNRLMTSSNESSLLVSSNLFVDLSAYGGPEDLYDLSQEKICKFLGRKIVIFRWEFFFAWNFESFSDVKDFLPKKHAIFLSKI